MANQPPLSRLHPGRPDVLALLVSSAALLVLGLSLPVVTIRNMAGLSESTYSVLSGIRALWTGGHRFLGALIFTFSLVFPIFKLSAIALLWYFPAPPVRRVVWLQDLKLLGKWSMLDVFVVAALLGTVRFGALTEATPRAGIYCFGAAILCSMVLIYLVAHLAHVSAEGYRPPVPLLNAFPFELPALILLGVGYDLPLMEVKKWVFWNREYSLLTGVGELASDGRWFLAAVITLFVIVAPAVKLLGYMLLRFVRPGDAGRARLVWVVLQLNRWSMGEVFALALLVASVKIGKMLELTPGPGLWCLLAGVFLSSLVSLPRFRRPF